MSSIGINNNSNYPLLVYDPLKLHSFETPWRLMGKRRNLNIRYSVTDGPFAMHPTPQSLISPELCTDIARNSTRAPMSLHQETVSSCQMALWQVFVCFMMFHNVLRVFHDVSLVVPNVLHVFHDLSQCFTSVSWCFTLFNNVLQCLVSRETISVSNCMAANKIMDCAAADRLRDHDNATGISDNSAEISNNFAEIGDDATGIDNIAKKVIPYETPSRMETGVTQFLEDKFQRGCRVHWRVGRRQGSCRLI